MNPSTGVNWRSDERADARPMNLWLSILVSVR
jgi:hypothetical protein